MEDDMTDAGMPESVDKPKRGRKPRIRKERKPRVTRSIIACIAVTHVPDFPADIKTMKQAHAWAKAQAEKGYNFIQFFRSLGSFKATPQTVMKFEIE